MNSKLAADDQQNSFLMHSDIAENSNVANESVGWVIIIGFALLNALALFGGAANLLHWAFPVGSALCALVLYVRYPQQYLAFAWWLWFLTPFARRLIDYYSQWVDPSPVLLAPFLVALLTLSNLLRRDERIKRRDYLPFVLAISAIIYALGIGVIQNNLMSVLPMLLNWLIPVLFGFHFLAHWRDYERMKRTTQSCFLWMVLLTGAYGIYQFIAAPAWDVLWLNNVDAASFGKAQVLEIRVFSTLNSPGPFGVVIMAGLLLLFSTRHWLRLPAAIVGFMSLLLSLARSSWIGWLVGFVVLLKSFDAKARFRVLIISICLIACLIPIALSEPFSQTISERFETLTNPQEDASAKARYAGYFEAAQRLSTQPIGTGFGGKTEFTTTEDDTAIAQRDSGIIDILLTFGWLGGTIYFAAVGLLFFSLLQRPSQRDDRFAIAARAVSFSLFAQFFFGSVMIAVSGVIFWSFCGIWLAARQYHAFLNDDFEEYSLEN